MCITNFCSAVRETRAAAALAAGRWGVGLGLGLGGCGAEWGVKRGLVCDVRAALGAVGVGRGARGPVIGVLGVGAERAPGEAGRDVERDALEGGAAGAGLERGEHGGHAAKGGDRDEDVGAAAHGGAHGGGERGGRVGGGAGGRGVGGLGDEDVRAQAERRAGRAEVAVRARGVVARVEERAGSGW